MRYEDECDGCGGKCEMGMGLSVMGVGMSEV